MTSNRSSIFLVGLLGLLLYIPTLRHAFVYDDQWTVVQNSSLDSVWPVSRFFFDADTAAFPPSGIQKDVYRPLPTLSLAVTKAMFGLNPVTFRSISLLLHAFNGVLLFLFLRRRVAQAPALVGAAFFLVHPVQVESVAWITQRSVVMCGTFSLLALVCWQRAKEKPAFGWTACLFFAAALLCKETALVLPLILAAQLHGRRDGRLAPLLACVPIALAYGWLRWHVLGHWGQPVQYDTTFLSSFGSGLAALAHYVHVLVWPARLNVSYQTPEALAQVAPAMGGGLIFLVGMVSLTVFLFQRKRPVALAPLVFLAFWLPHAGLTPLVTFAADRFLYLPMIGVAMMAAAVVSSRRSHLVIAWVLVSVLAVVSVNRMSAWKDEKALWASSVRVDDKNAFALACYAQELARAGDEMQAERYYKEALSHRPTLGLARSVLTLLIVMSERRGDTAMANVWREKLGTVPAQNPLSGDR